MIEKASLIAESTFTCKTCGVQAGKVQLFKNESNPNALPIVRVEGPACNSEFRFSQEEFPNVLAAVKAVDFKSLTNCRRDLAPFYCRSCSACYCRTHWNVDQVFDRDDSFYDCSYGTCPEGHRQKVDD